MTLQNLRKKYIGDRVFYSMLLHVAVPIMLQNGITNFVSMLDNIMVGQIGTEQMAGVSIVNQLTFVFNLCIFGGLSGIGIFTAQYYGSRDDEGIRHSVRFKMIVGVVIAAVAAIIFAIGGSALIRAFLTGSSDGGDLDATLGYGRTYLHIMFLYLLPFAVQQVYSTTLRECGETVVPMAAGLVAVFVNLGLNYILIFGKCGAPEMGVAGAAIATVIARFVETFIVIGWAHLHGERFTFLAGLYRNMRIPLKLVKRFVITGTPLLLNETLWSMGMAAINQCYSTRGLNAVAGMNIVSTLSNVFFVVFAAMGQSVGIIVGHALGAGDMKRAKDTDNKIIAFALMLSVGTGILEFIVGPYFPVLYNTTAEVKTLAAHAIMINALFMPVVSFTNSSYFTMRCGGKTLVTFFFDSVFVCVISFPLAFVLSRYTTLNLLMMYFIVSAADLIKCVVGYVLLKSNTWMQHIV